MTVYLNTDNPLQNFKYLLNSKYYVDKSNIIYKLNEIINTENRYVCITKPRTSTKSSIIDLVGAYYTKVIDSKGIFDELNISTSESYEKHLNKYNVLKIAFNNIPRGKNTYKKYMDMLETSLINDIKEKYPEIDINNCISMPEVFLKTKDKFIFIIDEWDYIFSHNLFEENQQDFLEFLRNLLKDKPYVALCYMTGVLPIKKYSEGSALNMFKEYTMLNDHVYSDFF